MALATLAGCGSPPVEPAPTSPAAERPQTATEGTWAGALTRIDASIARAEALAVEHANDWGRLTEVAGLYSERARWTGDYADYTRAEEALAEAFALAPEGAGPLLARAKLNYTLHRLDRVGPDLDALERQRNDDNKRAELLRFRGDLALQTGQPAVAEQLYQDSLALHPTMSARYGLVQVLWQAARFDEALAGLDECEALVKGAQPSNRMWLDLQRGLVELSRGRHEHALAHYQAADAHVSGHWLVREHIAEVTALLGRPDEALAMYEQIVADTGNPEFMDAIGGLLRDAGDAEGAARWMARADAAFAAQLARYPEAAAGHALDHFLDGGGDPAATVALAERNAALRPNGEALTKLASAYRAAGRLADAEAALARAVATTLESADLHAEAAEIARARGDEATATRETSRARELNPHLE